MKEVTSQYNHLKLEYDESKSRSKRITEESANLIHRLQEEVEHLRAKLEQQALLNQGSPTNQDEPKKGKPALSQPLPANSSPVFTPLRSSTGSPSSSPLSPREESRVKEVNRILGELRSKRAAEQYKTDEMVVQEEFRKLEEEKRRAEEERIGKMKEQRLKERREALELSKKLREERRKASTVHSGPGEDAIICAKCNKEVVFAARSVEFQEKKYHDRCLRCHKCRVQFTKDISVQNGKFLCKDCAKVKKIILNSPVKSVSGVQ